MTPFVRSSDIPLPDLGKRAVMAAVRDAGITAGAIEASFVGSSTAGPGIGQEVLKDLGILDIPITNVENACASGGDAFRLAVQAVESGRIEVALALGLDASTRSTVEPRGAFRAGTDESVTPPSIYAMRAVRYMHDHDVPLAQLAAVSVKNRRHGLANEMAVFTSPVSAADVLESPMIADPLTRLQCCPPADGAAAAVVRRAPVPGAPRVEALAMRAGRLQDHACAQDTLSARTAREAYEAAGLGPAELDVCEVHDAFAIGELLAIEALGICPEGKAGRYVEDGHADVGGDGIAVNPSGGLISRGHPQGATGLAQIVEATLQLTGRGGRRQVEGARIALCHNRGGNNFDLEADACVVTILSSG